jgi:predicted MFS family arabinose efflux permease
MDGWRQGVPAPPGYPARNDPWVGGARRIVPAGTFAPERGLGARLRRRAAFWGVAYAFLVSMLGTTLPTPLYHLYQERLGFSAGILTVIFAVYAAGALTALVLFGNLSDNVGRRPVLAGALALAAGSTAIFLSAGGLAFLLAGRLISGLVAGLVTSTATAALTELEPRRDTRRASLVSTAASITGLGLGPLLAGVLAQYGRSPLRLPFAVYLALLVPAFVAVWATPETVTGPPSAPRWEPQRPGVSPPVRSAFPVAAAAGFAGFAVLGLFTSLSPTFVRQELGIGNLAVAGAVVFAVLGASSAAQLLLHGLRERQALGIGLLALPLGLLLILLALGRDSLALFVSGALVSGLGQGLAYMGGLATINRLAPAGERGENLASYFVVSYAAISAPVIGLGFAAEAFGLYDAALVFATAIGALALATEAVAFVGPARVRLARGVPCSKGWLAAHNLWRGC